MEIKDVIRNRRLEKGLTMKELAKLIGVNEGTISRWESGEISNMRRDRVARLSEVLSIPIEFLMGWDPTDIPSNDEPPISAKEAFGQQKAEIYQIPVVATIAAGEPIYSEEHIIEWIDYAKPCENGKRFATKIKGNSMFPLIHDGDTIIIDTTVEWGDNDIVVATVNGNEGTCKRIKKYSDGIALISLNPQYEPMRFTAQEVNTLPVQIIGKVVESRTSL